MVIDHKLKKATEEMKISFLIGIMSLTNLGEEAQKKLRIKFERIVKSLYLTDVCYKNKDALILFEVSNSFKSNDAQITDKTLENFKTEMAGFFEVFRGDKIAKYKKCERGNCSLVQKIVQVDMFQGLSVQDVKLDTTPRSGLLTKKVEVTITDFTLGENPEDPEQSVSKVDDTPMQASWPYQTVPMAFLEDGVCGNEPWAGYFSGTVGEIILMGEWTQNQTVKQTLLPPVTDADKHNRRCNAALGASFLIDLGMHSAVEVRPAIKRYLEGKFESSDKGFENILFNASEDKYFVKYVPKDFKGTDVEKAAATEKEAESKAVSKNNINTKCRDPWLLLKKSTNEICRLYYENYDGPEHPNCKWRSTEYKERSTGDDGKWKPEMIKPKPDPKKNQPTLVTQKTIIAKVDPNIKKEKRRKQKKL